MDLDAKLDREKRRERPKNNVHHSRSENYKVRHARGGQKHHDAYTHRVARKSRKEAIASYDEDHGIVLPKSFTCAQKRQKNHTNVDCGFLIGIFNHYRKESMRC